MSKDESTSEITKKNNISVLNRYRVEKNGKDAGIYERVRLSDRFAGQKGVSKFESPNGEIIYYTERLVKKYSDNVVKA